MQAITTCSHQPEHTQTPILGRVQAAYTGTRTEGMQHTQAHRQRESMQREERHTSLGGAVVRLPLAGL